MNMTMNMNKTDSYETFYYCGEHVDGCDQDGPIIVYHYISKSRVDECKLNLNCLNPWEYDLEFWPGDYHWEQASLKKDILFNMNMEIVDGV